MTAQAAPDTQPAPSRREERNTFLFLAVFLAPILTVGLVGAMGFSIWFWQMIFGPPG